MLSDMLHVPNPQGIQSSVGPRDETRSKFCVMRSLFCLSGKRKLAAQSKGNLHFCNADLRALSVVNGAKQTSFIQKRVLFMHLPRLNRELLLPNIWPSLPTGKTLLIELQISH